MSGTTRHADWLDLMEVSGPFLAEPVLDRAFPQGLDELDPLKRRILRQAYDEWREALDLGDAQFPELHRAWIDLVLKKGLELDENGKGEVLKPAVRLPASLSCQLPEYGITLKPDYAVVDDRHEDKPMMLIRFHDPDVKLDETIRNNGWATTPAERMVHLCRATKTRLGLITNGECWMLVDAPEGGITTYASWYSRLWGQEPVTLQSFVALLGIRRFFVDKSEQLPALFDESLKHQDEVTESLGEQVRRAVEVLIQALDRADVDRNRELLHGVEPAELYEAGLTVMMRLVFLLCAEERDLLLLGDERYEADYAVSTLRRQLRDDAHFYSDEILALRKDAWSRLLAVFRAVYGGIEHEMLRMPALGGSLFDPDRFPFLEGRAKSTNWRLDEATPLPIDNRTVLLLLEAIQMHRGRTLSYRGLDVEQIGYVYEGLLERTAVRAKEVTLDLDATKNADKPWVSLGEVESAKLNSVEALEKVFHEHIGSSISRVRNDLKKPVDETAAERLLTACHGDQALRDRIKPYFHLLRTDRWGYPLVYPKGAYMVTTGSDRRETGTHYTPKSFTEAIITETLEPVVYKSPSEGIPREQWRLKSPSELLDLKICDLAMGSGAFLVQVCRWLSERLVESWGQAEGQGKAIDPEGQIVDSIAELELLTRDAEGRLIVARRLIVERCLYGVDINPLAVELAKLSIWLVTLSKGRPFGFLDHNLRCGDSLLGIQNLDQLHYLDMKPGEGSERKLFAQKIDQAVSEAIGLRMSLRRRPIREIHDVEVMADLDLQARKRLELPELIADALVADVLKAGGMTTDTAALSIEAGRAIDGEADSARAIELRAREGLSSDLPVGKPLRNPFHWPLEFPEVFNRESGGFDSIVGNPPFVGGQLISGSFGASYKDYLTRRITSEKTASVDLVVYFFLRAFDLLRSNGDLGLIARRSMSEGKNRQAGLEKLLSRGGVIYVANTDIPWPGKASVVVHHIHITKADWCGKYHLNGKPVKIITSHLNDVEMWTAVKLVENEGRMFQGTILLGEGFKIDERKARDLIRKDRKYESILYPFIGGNEVNKDPAYTPMCWVINFWDWPEGQCKKYEIAYQKVKKDVLPERLKQKNAAAKERWWIHYRFGFDLYHKIGRGHSYTNHPDGWDPSVRPMGRVLVISTGVTKYPSFTFLPGNYVFSNKLCVLADDRYAMFAILSSDIHGVWAWAHKTSLGGDLHSLVYAHGNIFETFPFPTSMAEGKVDPAIGSLGKSFFEGRQTYMLAHDKGLTKFYNDFHDRGIDSPEMNDLRDLQRRINDAVLDRYGWNDVSPGYGFHAVGYLPEGDNSRFTVSEAARVELLFRLAALNKERHQYEVRMGLASESTAKKGTNTQTARSKRVEAAQTDQQDLFSEADP
jgi:methylase of polypeptide subunit release factors